MFSTVRGTWFRKYGIHHFGGTRVQGTGYIVSYYPCDGCEPSALSLIYSANSLSTLVGKVENSVFAAGGQAKELVLSSRLIQSVCESFRIVVRNAETLANRFRQL